MNIPSQIALTDDAFMFEAYIFEGGAKLVRHSGANTVAFTLTEAAAKTGEAHRVGRLSKWNSLSSIAALLAQAIEIRSGRGTGELANLARLVEDWMKRIVCAD